MKKKRKATRIVSVLLAVTLMFSLVGCGMFDKQKEDENPAPTAAVSTDVTNAPTEAPSDTHTDETVDIEQNDPNVPADQDEIDKALEESLQPTATPTPEPTAAPAPEVMPTLEELILQNVNTQNLGENYEMTMKFAYDVEAEEDGISIKMNMKMDANMLAYGGSSYTDTYLYMSYLGMEEEELVKEYEIADKNTMTMTSYSYDSADETWYKSTSTYIDLSGTDAMIDVSDMDVSDFSKIEVTSDDNYYYAVAEAIPGSDLEGSALVGDFGFGDIAAVTTYTFKFDKSTKEFVSLEIICALDDVLSPDELEAQGIKSINMEDIVVTYGPNSNPIIVPDDIIKNAVEADDYWEDDDWDEEPSYSYDDEEESIHAGWGNWYNSYNSSTGKFEMTYGEDGDDIDVTLNGKDGWYYDNSWSFGTYLIVRDDKLDKDGPAHQVFYGDSKVKVNYDNFERAFMELLKNDYDEQFTSQDIVPIVVNEKQAFYFVSYSSNYSRTINVLQDIGTGTYLSIDIDTCDVNTPDLAMVEKFLLSFTLDDAQ